MWDRWRQGDSSVRLSNALAPAFEFGGSRRRTSWSSAQSSSQPSCRLRRHKSGNIELGCQLGCGGNSGVGVDILSLSAIPTARNPTDLLCSALPVVTFCVCPVFLRIPFLYYYVLRLLFSTYLHFASCCTKEAKFQVPGADRRPVYVRTAQHPEILPRPSYYLSGTDQPDSLSPARPLSPALVASPA